MVHIGTKNIFLTTTQKTNPQVPPCRVGPGDRGPTHPPRQALTQASHGECTGSGGRRDAVGEHGLQHVVGEGHGDDGQAGGVHDEHGAPEQQEAGMSQGPSGAGLSGPSRPSGPRCGERGCTLSPGTQGCCGRPEAGFGPGRQGPPCRGLCSADELFQRRWLFSTHGYGLPLGRRGERLGNQPLF